MLPCVLSRSITDATGRHSTLNFPGENLSWWWAGAVGLGRVSDQGNSSQHPGQLLRAGGPWLWAPWPGLLFQALSCQGRGCVMLQAGRPQWWQHNVPRSSVSPSQLLLVPSAVPSALLTLPRPSIHLWVLGLSQQGHCWGLHSGRGWGPVDRAAGSQGQRPVCPLWGTSSTDTPIAALSLCLVS